MLPTPRWFTPRLRHFLLQFALVAGAVALLWWTLRAMGASGAWGEAWALLRQLSWRAVAALVALNALVLWTLMLRWWLFLRAQGVRIGQLRLLSYRLAGFAISYFTPGPQIGGEPLQIYLLARKNAAHPPVPLATATASITLDKLLEFSTNFALLLIGAIFLLQRQANGEWGGQTSAGALIQVGLYATLFAGLLIILWRLSRGRLALSTLLAQLANRLPTRWNTARLRMWRNGVERVERQALAVAHERPSAVAGAVIVSLLGWALMIGEFWFSTWILGFELSLGEAVLALIIMRAAYLLPMPAAIGSLEATLVWAMITLGLPPAAGISLSLLIRVRDVLLGAAGLLVAVIEVGSLRAVTNFSSPTSTQ